MARQPFSLLHIPRPRSFLWLMSLRTGTELIALTVLINKISGFYGILALFTGFHLSPLQLSMYIYSIGALGLTLYLMPSIRKYDPFNCMALAWFYLFDSIINAAYTALFSVSWFAVLLAHHSGQENVGSGVPGGKMIGDTSGFTTPEVQNVTRVNVAATPAKAGLLPGQVVETVPVTDASGSSSSLSNAVFDSASIASVSVICMLWALRFYFVLIVFAYARQVLRQHVHNTSFTRQDFALQHTGTTDGLADNPFAEGREEGMGWRGKLGRLMVSTCPSYWLGADSWDDRFAMDPALFKSSRLTPPQLHERERRRRGGTGPSQPSMELKEYQS